MGISGLLPFVNAATDKEAHVREFAHKRVAVDGYCWLHTGAHSCAFELCQSIETTKYIAFFMSRINMLLYYKVIPVVVFDGARLPIKDEVEKSRARFVLGAWRRCARGFESFFVVARLSRRRALDGDFVIAAEWRRPGKMC